MVEDGCAVEIKIYEINNYGQQKSIRNKSAQETGQG